MFIRFATRASILLLFVAPAVGGSSDRLERDVKTLAAESLEGRLTGSAGERLAAKHIIAELESLGAVPVPGTEGFSFGFEFTAGTNDTGSSLSIAGAEGSGSDSWTGIEQVRGLSFSDNGKVSGPLVFAGYGLETPEAQDFSYNSYFGLDVKDKIVVVLRYWPEDVDDEMRADLSQYSGLRHKALVAREHGAKALIVVTGPNSPNAGKTIEAKFDAALSGSGIIAASVSGPVADRLFREIEGGIEKSQSALDTGNPHVSGFELPGLEVTLEVKVERERRTGQNVIGLLPASPIAEGESAGDRPYLVLGAHYDHLGRGRHGNSLAKRDEVGQVHLGADDNASGVATVLEVGRRMADRPRPASIVLAFWSGEELGLIGADAFVDDPPVPLEQVTAYVNFDMVGRVRDNRINLQGVGSSSVWPRLIERSNVVVGFDARMQSDPYLPTDASVWYLAEVPILGFFTGSHEDYHRPGDSADKINYEDLERVAQFATILTRKIIALEQRPEYVKVDRRPETTGERDSVRAYTGTLPDYATEVQGLRLSGVIGGGPAEKAGLQEGDIIVEFAGREIANIYDYTYALGSVKVGEPVKVVCERDGERIEVTIVPTTRP